MSIRKLQASLPWLGNERIRTEGLPRFHLLYPSFRALAREVDAAFEWKPGGIAARLASVLVHAGDKIRALRVGCEVRAPAVGEPGDPPQGRVGRHRLSAAAHAEPDGDRPLDRHGVEPGVADPMELAAEVHDLFRPQR